MRKVEYVESLQRMAREFEARHLNVEAAILEREANRWERVIEQDEADGPDAGDGYDEWK